MSESKCVYVDYLCFESLYTLIKSDHKNCQIYYWQKSIILPNFIINLVSKKISSSVKVIPSVSLTEEFVGGINLLEKIETDLTKAVNSWADKELGKNQLFISFVKRMGYSQCKLRAYIENKAFKSLHRSFEVIAFANNFSENSSYVILKKQHLSNLLDLKSVHGVIWYQRNFSKYFSVTKRKDYIYDDLNAREFKDIKLTLFLKSVYYFFKTVLLLWQRKKEQNKQAVIGVDQYQRFLREEGANDLFWFDSKLIKSKYVLYLAHTDLENISLEFLSTRGIKLVYLNPSIRKITKSFIFNKNLEHYIVPTFGFYMEILRFSFKKMTEITLDDDSLWLARLLKEYAWRELYWRDIYKQLDIKLLWSMADGCEDSLIRAQSIEKNEGFFLGANYSFYQYETVHAQKMYDIYFSWGEYFSKRIVHRNYNKKSIYIEVGYIADSHFYTSKKTALRINQNIHNKYIVSYIDNNTGYDLELSRNMSFNMISMFLKLLNKYKYMILFLKPKRQYEIDVLMRKFPLFVSYVNSGRIKIYMGKEDGERFPPATIGKASDLVVCLGINTAGIECFLAGANVVYANLSKFRSSKFYKEGVGKIIFNSLQEIYYKVDHELASQETINIRDKDKIIYQDLDRFQDGCSYLRVGQSIASIIDVIKTAPNDRNIIISNIRSSLPSDLVLKEYNI